MSGTHIDDAPEVSCARDGSLSRFEETSCIGESCPYYSGNECEAHWRLLETEEHEDGEPRLLDVGRFALYGYICSGAEEEHIMRQEAHKFQSGVSNEVIQQYGAVYGDMPLTIQGKQCTVEVRTR